MRKMKTKVTQPVGGKISEFDYSTHIFSRFVKLSDLNWQTVNWVCILLLGPAEGERLMVRDRESAHSRRGPKGRMLTIF